jgi:hypothetical protein
MRGDIREKQLSVAAPLSPPDRTHRKERDVPVPMFFNRYAPPAAPREPVAARCILALNANRSCNSRFLADNQLAEVVFEGDRRR